MMTKKGIIATVLVAIATGICGIIIKHVPQNPDLEIETVMKTPAREFDITKFHSDILELIIASQKKVYNISPEEAKAVLDKRTGEEVEANRIEANVQELPFDIVRLISESPASVAGISPQKAGNEILRRYLALDTAGEDDIDSVMLINAINQRKQKEAIDNWQENEENEAIEAFLKEKADKDPSSIAGAAYGVKHFQDDHDKAVEYIKKFDETRSATGNKEQSEDQLLEALRNME